MRNYKLVFVDFYDEMAMKAAKKQIAEWKKFFDALVAEGRSENGGGEPDDYWVWVHEEADFESICVGWCMAHGMTLADALDFYQQMIPLRLF